MKNIDFFFAKEADTNFFFFFFETTFKKRGCLECLKSHTQKAFLPRISVWNSHLRLIYNISMFSLWVINKIQHFFLFLFVSDFFSSPQIKAYVCCVEKSNKHSNSTRGKNTKKMWRKKHFHWNMICASVYFVICAYLQTFRKKNAVEWKKIFGIKNGFFYCMKKDTKLQVDMIKRKVKLKNLLCRSRSCKKGHSLRNQKDLFFSPP